MGSALDGTTGNTDGDGRYATALSSDNRPRAAERATYQHLADDDRGTGGQSNADFLGYFALGLGLAEVLAPKAMAKLVGIREPDGRNRATVRLMGLREMASGAAILASEMPTNAMWARVAGDMLDLALLGGTFANGENARGRTLFATANVLAVAALDVMTARQLSRQPRTTASEALARGIVRTKRSVTVRRGIEDVYGFWRDFTNFPRFMRHLASVVATGERRSHWAAHGPGGRTVEWDAETTADVPNERIAWRSLPGADVDNRGTVEFREAPDGLGSEVHLTLEYRPPLGKLGSKVAMLFREEPGQEVYDALRHFKQVMETGDIVVSDATRRRGPHPAVPERRESR